MSCWLMHFHHVKLYLCHPLVSFFTIWFSSMSWYFCKEKSWQLQNYFPLNNTTRHDTYICESYSGVLAWIAQCSSNNHWWLLTWKAVEETARDSNFVQSLITPLICGLEKLGTIWHCRKQVGLFCVASVESLVTVESLCAINFPGVYISREMNVQRSALLGLEAKEDKQLALGGSKKAFQVLEKELAG